MRDPDIVYTSSFGIEFANKDPESYEMEPISSSITLEIIEDQTISKNKEIVKENWKPDIPLYIQAALPPGVEPHPNAIRASEFAKRYFKLHDGPENKT